MWRSMSVTSTSGSMTDVTSGNGCSLGCRSDRERRNGAKKVPFLLTRRRGLSLSSPPLDNTLPVAPSRSATSGGAAPTSSTTTTSASGSTTPPHTDTQSWTMAGASRQHKHVERELVEIWKLTENVPEAKGNAKLEIIRLVHFNLLPFVERPSIFLGGDGRVVTPKRLVFLRSFDERTGMKHQA